MRRSRASPRAGARRGRASTCRGVRGRSDRHGRDRAPTFSGDLQGDPEVVEDDPVLNGVHGGRGALVVPPALSVPRADPEPFAQGRKDPPGPGEARRRRGRIRRPAPLRPPWRGSGGPGRDPRPPGPRRVVRSRRPRRGGCVRRRPVRRVRGRVRRTGSRSRCPSGRTRGSRRRARGSCRGRSPPGGRPLPPSERVRRAGRPGRGLRPSPRRTAGATGRPLRASGAASPPGRPCGGGRHRVRARPFPTSAARW